jgi:glycosyltransferase involved in cell wall biosynthesis
MSVFGEERPDYLGACLKSLMCQTSKADEVILVEDGPVGGDLNIEIEKYRDVLNIVSVRLPTNVGLARALNVGLQHCSYDLVARMDTDDIALQDRFEKQVQIFKENPSLDILGGFAEEFFCEEKKVILRKMPVLHEDICANLFACPFIHPTVMFKKGSIASIGGYSEGLTRRQDYELWFRCAKAGFQFYNLPQSVLLYRFSPNTHRKQSKNILFKQGVIGFKGVRSLQQPLWKGFACFFPFVRSFFPVFIQQYIYTVSKKIDPRQKADCTGSR